MQITSLVDIVGGKLLNTPSISFITQIEINPSKIKDGDLFVAKDIQDIPLAIQNGAFAILFDKDTTITDDEIAWIKVYDTKEALLKLTRFYLSSKNTQGFDCDYVSYELLKIYSYLDKNIIFLNNNIFDDFKLLNDISNENIIFGTDKSYLNKLLPLSKKFIVKDNFKIDNLIQHSLFYTTFSYKDRYYYKIKLPQLYINHLLNVSKFLNVSLDTTRLKLFEYFNPIFINKDFKIVEFGSTNKFILANNNAKLYDKEIEFLKKYYTYGKIKITNNIEDIKTLQFNVLYIKGKLTKEIQEILPNITNL